ncbi:hypothetical protein PLEOSDRAFT_155405 [Pleurotus ostreatus PC15]|uniref:Phosphoglycerate mutase-like protein n=2 Tax=Pleurotus TaxID=5320 RepID=A0A067P4E1_PLEO1|nr:hypothetical protein CCMSSC00406_0000445 [Pleurotus cornucopiae]KDQ30736.1 hypothetical protein PLEOSDRAFT_155405 [Pleurotus ostreatus PC15]
MVRKIYIARHGFRLNWVNTNWKSPTGLARDPPLAAYGEKQAQELADHFLSLPEEERPTVIFSSPYYRCLQTSKPVSKALGIPIYVEHGLSEWYSPVAPGTGLHPRPGSAADLQSYFPEIDPSWSSIWHTSQKGEDVEEVHERTNGFLEVFVPEVERRFGPDSKVLLVTHAATTITLVRGLIGDRDHPLKVGCCSLSTFDRKERSRILGGWEAKLLADGQHLAGGSDREWGFDYIEVAYGKVVEDSGVPGTESDLEGPVGAQISPAPAQIASNL